MSRYDTYKTRAQIFLNQRFGKLLIIEIVDRNDTRITSKKRLQKTISVKCVCECGNEIFCTLSDLKSGHTKTCGCGQVEASARNIAIANSMSRSWIKSRPPMLGTAWHIFKFEYGDADLCFDDFLSLTQQNCFYCGAAPSNRRNIYTPNNYSDYRVKEGTFIYNGLDRIDNSKYHTKDNVVPCCKQCNKGKLTMSTEDFFRWVKKIYELHSLGPLYNSFKSTKTQ